MEPSIAFGHNILFDYATSRLWLDLLSDQALVALCAPAGQDLLLAIRPSIVFAFEALWHRDAARTHFWRRALACQVAEMRLIGKIIGPGVAAEQFRSVGDVDVLLSAIAAGAAGSADLLHSFVTAAMSRHQGAPEKYPVAGEQAPEWLPLAAGLTEHIAIAAWDIQRLIGPIVRRSVTLTATQSQAANAAGLALVRYGLSDTRYNGYVRAGLEVATETIAANPNDTEAIVRTILTPEMVKQGGHEWLPAITERLDRVAASNAILAVDVVETAFTASASRDEQVPMGSRLLSLTFNKHDMLASARHHVSTRFP